MIDKKIVAKNFSAQFKNYDDFALVQKKCAKKLCDFSKKFIKNNDFVLDLGSGTSFVSKDLSTHKSCKIFETDISFNMLQSWQNRPSDCFAINCDISQLPFKNATFDFIISSFALQWLEDFDKLFASLQQIAKVGTIVAFCFPIEYSLEKIKNASRNSGCNFNFRNLANQNNIKEKLLKNNFKEILFLEETIAQESKDGVGFLKNIKKIGANYREKKNLINKKKLQKFRYYLRNL